MNQLIQNNSDFLFLYEAILSNPNGDPDQENKPRMDYDTRTNLVTDVRLKRYIRDFLKQKGMEVFVDMEGEIKVGMDKKLESVLSSLCGDDEKIKQLIGDDELFNSYLNEVKAKDDIAQTVNNLVNKKPKNKEVNLALLAGLVKNRFVDIRMFGSAFAIDGFNRALTGPIQLNWGYSLNDVYLLESSTISSIMNDGNSTFGKDYRVKFSLLAFHGSINKYAAQTTGLTENDRSLFREALWSGIAASPTRSKLNQYPKLYLELIYNEGYHNGHFGDLRNLISTSIKDGKKGQEVTRLSDLEINLTSLEEALGNQIGSDKPLKEVVINSTADMNKPIFS